MEQYSALINGASIPAAPKPAAYIPRHSARFLDPERTARRRARTLRSVGTSAAVAALSVTGVAAGQVAHAPQAEAAQGDIVQASSRQRAVDMQRLLDLINSYRQSRGLGTVKFSQQLSGIVQSHSDTLIRSESIYHSTSFLTDSRAGRYTSANEIIALSYQSDVTQLVDWWKSSPAHNAALLNPKAQVIGIGLTYTDGTLQNSWQPWKVLSTINLYGYASGGAPSDATSAVGGVPSYAQAPTYSVKGGIGQAYYSGGGGQSYGVPVMDEARGSYGGWWQIFNKNGLRYKFMWGSASGAHVVNEFGAIHAVWRASDYERGYGFPTTDEYWVGAEIRQGFSNGYTVAWDSRDGSVRVFRG